jgi:hypothetical protein
MVIFRPSALEETPGVMGSHAFVATTIGLSALFAPQMVIVPAAEGLSPLAKHFVETAAALIGLLLAFGLLAIGAYISAAVVRAGSSIERAFQTAGYFLGAYAFVCLLFHVASILLIFLVGTWLFKPLALVHDILLLLAIGYCLFLLPGKIYCRASSWLKQIAFVVCFWLGIATTSLVLFIPYGWLARSAHSPLAGIEVIFPRKSRQG